MATLAEVEAHRAALNDLNAVMLAELLAFWRAQDLANQARVAAETRAFVPELIAAYGLAAGTLGVDWYADLREAAGVTRGFAPVAPPRLPSEQVQAVISWDLKPLFPSLTTEQVALFAPEPEPDPDAALARLAGSAQRLVAEADRAAIAVNVDADPSAPRYARHASANACAFCAVLATRGPIYRSEDTAGDKYHDHCHCVAVPVWDAFEEAPYVGEWREAYYAAAETLGGANDMKAILAQMREAAGLK